MKSITQCTSSSEIKLVPLVPLVQLVLWQYQPTVFIGPARPFRPDRSSGSPRSTKLNGALSSTVDQLDLLASMEALLQMVSVKLFTE